MYHAIGVIELKSIAKGIEATDSALKSAGISLVSARPACPGKYEIILTGSISNVKSVGIYASSWSDLKTTNFKIMKYCSFNRKEFSMTIILLLF